jgi:hypothetical protein
MTSIEVNHGGTRITIEDRGVGTSHNEVVLGLQVDSNGNMTKLVLVESELLALEYAIKKYNNQQILDTLNRFKEGKK